MNSLNVINDSSDFFNSLFDAKSDVLIISKNVLESNPFILSVSNDNFDQIGL